VRPFGWRDLGQLAIWPGARPIAKTTVNMSIGNPEGAMMMPE